jgi:glyoxylate reductase
MNKARILVTSCLPGQMQNLLADDFDLEVKCSRQATAAEFNESALAKDALLTMITDKIDAAFFESHPEIKLVANVAVGYDNIDLKAAQSQGVLVCNTPGVLSESTADLAFALMLACARRLTESERFLRRGLWKCFSLDLLLGCDVHHKTLGIVGLGRIGEAFARRARGFSMNILYSQRRRADAAIEKEIEATYLSLPELLAASDFVSLHCPLHEATRHLIDSDELKLMKKSAILINTARGAIVNEAALADALREGIIAGAGLDVFEDEPRVTPGLLELENVVLLPHTGSATVETRTAMARMAVESVLSAFRGKLPANALNPECWPSFLSRSCELGLIHD